MHGHIFFQVFLKFVNMNLVASNQLTVAEKRDIATVTYFSAFFKFFHMVPH